MQIRKKITLSMNPEVLEQARVHLAEKGLPISRQFERGIKLFFEKEGVKGE